MIKETVDAVIKEMMDNPNDFKCASTTNQVWHHAKTKISYKGDFMIFTGVITPYLLSFGIYHGFRFRKALEQLKCYQTLLNLQEKE